MDRRAGLCCQEVEKNIGEVSTILIFCENGIVGGCVLLKAARVALKPLRTVEPRGTLIDFFRLRQCMYC